MLSLQEVLTACLILKSLILKSIRLRCRHSIIFQPRVQDVSFSIPWLAYLVSDIDNQFSIAGIQFSILVLPRNNFERFLKLYNTSHRQGNVTIKNGKTTEQCMDKKTCYSFISPIQKSFFSHFLYLAVFYLGVLLDNYWICAHEPNHNAYKL